MATGLGLEIRSYHFEKNVTLLADQPQIEGYYNEGVYVSKSKLAVTYVNMVRTRARDSYMYDEKLPGYPDIPNGLLPNIQDNGQDGVRTSIRHERRVELGFEFHRYFDIIRYGSGYANKAFQDKPNFDYETNKFMPYPQSELDRNFEL